MKVVRETQFNKTINYTFGFSSLGLSDFVFVLVLMAQF